MTLTIPSLNESREAIKRLLARADALEAAGKAVEARLSAVEARLAHQARWTKQQPTLWVSRTQD